MRSRSNPSGRTSSARSPSRSSRASTRSSSSAARSPSTASSRATTLHGLTPGAYRCGQVFGIRIDVAGISLYHQGSADLIESAVPRDGVDVFLAGVAGRSVTPRYWDRILPLLDPRVVVPTHYDNFFTPLDRPLDFTARVKLAEVPAEVRAVSADAEVVALPRVDAD